LDTKHGKVLNVSIFVPILTYGYEYWVLAERALLQMQRQSWVFRKNLPRDAT